VLCVNCVNAVGIPEVSFPSTFAVGIFTSGLLPESAVVELVKYAYRLMDDNSDIPDHVVVMTIGPDAGATPFETSAKLTADGDAVRVRVSPSVRRGFGFAGPILVTCACTYKVAVNKSSVAMLRAA
jgi:hypothetical protein